MPGHIEALVEKHSFERPTPEDALEFGHQHKQVLVDLEMQYIADRTKSALVVFPNALTIKVPGRGRYNQIVMGATEGRLAVHYDYVVPWKPEIAFAFISTLVGGE